MQSEALSGEGLIWKCANTSSKKAHFLENCESLPLLHFVVLVRHMLYYEAMSGETHLHELHTALEGAGTTLNAYQLIIKQRQVVWVKRCQQFLLMMSCYETGIYQVHYKLIKLMSVREHTNITSLQLNVFGQRYSPTAL